MNKALKHTAALPVITPDMREKLLAAGREDLIIATEITLSGYAGITEEGTIVDRRDVPGVIPILENPLFGSPAPLPLTPRDEMILCLRRDFPLGWWRRGEDFSPEYAGHIWSGEGATVETPDSIFLPFAEAFDMDFWKDTNGVEPRLYQYLLHAGWLVEWYDGGTVLIVHDPAHAITILSQSPNWP